MSELFDSKYNRNKNKDRQYSAEEFWTKLKEDYPDNIFDVVPDSNGTKMNMTCKKCNDSSMLVYGTKVFEGTAFPIVTFHAQKNGRRYETSHFVYSVVDEDVRLHRHD